MARAHHADKANFMHEIGLATFQKLFPAEYVGKTTRALHTHTTHSLLYIFVQIHSIGIFYESHRRRRHASHYYATRTTYLKCNDAAQ